MDSRERLIDLLWRNIPANYDGTDQYQSGEALNQIADAILKEFIHKSEAWKHCDMKHRVYVSPMTSTIVAKHDADLGTGLEIKLKDEVGKHMEGE